MKEIAARESIATGITTEVEELQKRNRDSFTIPEWFVYTSRAFGTLEGVSLQADDSFSLIQSCFPYIAKRLMADDSPRAQRALRDMIYGASNVVDVTRLGDLAEGFTTYTTTTKTLNKWDGKDTKDTKEVNPKTAQNKFVEAEAAITLAKDSADLLLDAKGNLVQNLLVEESVLAASARVKDQLKEALVDGPQKFRDSLPFGVGGLLPPLPFEFAMAPFVKKTETEEKALQLVTKLTALVQQSPMSQDGKLQMDRQALNTLVSDLEPEQAALIVKELRENLPKYTPLVGHLGSKFMATLLEKASENIDNTLTELEVEGKNDQLLSVAARGLSNAAKQGANAIKQRYSKRETEENAKTRTVVR